MCGVIWEVLGFDGKLEAGVLENILTRVYVWVTASLGQDNKSAKRVLEASNKPHKTYVIWQGLEEKRENYTKGLKKNVYSMNRNEAF